MTKKKLKAYKRIRDMCARIEGGSDIVTGSGGFPYLPHRVTISGGDSRLLEEMEEVEDYISGIEDGITRNIFQWVFIDGMTQEEAGRIVNYSQSQISRIIDDTLKDA